MAVTKDKQGRTMVPLKTIIDQFNSMLNLTDDESVAAVMDDDGEIIGWNHVRRHEDGTITPITDTQWNEMRDVLRYITVRQNMEMARRQSIMRGMTGMEYLSDGYLGTLKYKVWKR